MRKRKVLRTAGLVGLGMIMLVAAACSPQEDLATFNTKMFNTAIGPAISEWKTKHAEVIGVSVSNINTRWDQGGGQLDTQPAKDYWFDLSTDFCSSSPDTGLAYDFKAPCVRHDFGWRNLKKLDRHWNCAGAGTNRPCGQDGRPVGALGAYYNRSNKLIVNDQFKRDMDAHCATRSIFLRPDCYSAATLYHAVVNLAA